MFATKNQWSLGTNDVYQITQILNGSLAQKPERQANDDDDYDDDDSRMSCVEEKKEMLLSIVVSLASR